MKNMIKLNLLLNKNFLMEYYLSIKKLIIKLVLIILNFYLIINKEYLNMMKLI